RDLDAGHLRRDFECASGGCADAVAGIEQGGDGGADRDLAATVRREEEIPRGWCGAAAAARSEASGSAGQAGDGATERTGQIGAGKGKGDGRSGDETAERTTRSADRAREGNG